MLVGQCAKLRVEIRGRDETRDNRLDEDSVRGDHGVLMQRVCGEGTPPVLLASL